MFTFNVAEAETEVADLRRVTQELLRAWEEADSAADRLRGSWTGDAADAYGTSHDEWKTQIDTMMESLATMHGALRTATDNYASAANTNVRMWSTS